MSPRSIPGAGRPDPNQETVLLNATVGVQRVIARLRPTPARRSPAAATFPRRSLSIVSVLRARRSIGRPRISADRGVSLVAVGLVAAALAVSNLDVGAAGGPTGNTSGAGSEPRIALGGGVEGIQGSPQDAAAFDDDGAVEGNVGDVSSLQADLPPALAGPFDALGTLVKPGSVDTTVSDGKDLIREYRVKPGDTLTGIAHQFRVTMMTVWWANHLSSKNDLHIGQILVIPPVSGVVVTVSATDTLDALAAKYDVDPDDIVDANELTDPNLVVGQVLTIPGARNSGIAEPKPKPKPSSSGGSSSSGHSGSGTSSRP